MTTPIRLSIVLLIFCSRIITAQTPERRVALVVGNSHYTNAPLSNPSNDARDMAVVLRRAGFTVTEKYDQSLVEFNNAVTDFTRKFTDPQTVALFYYAGHGIQDNNENYLVPIDADSLDDDEITYRCVSLERITSKMRGANNYMNIIILDACRNYPVQMKGRSLQSGLAQFDDNMSESLIAYATAPGRIALDQKEKANGLFTENLLKHIITPGLEISELFFEVRKEVKEQSGNKQIPSVTNNLTRKFYFFDAVEPPQTQPVPADTDKDGVPDILDNCPHAPGVISLNGCPEEKKSKNKPKLDQAAGLEIAFSRAGDYKHIYYQAHYQIAAQIGGFISFGGGKYTNSDVYDNSEVAGAAGLGVRVLNTPSRIRVYTFVGLFMYNSFKYQALECLVSCNIGPIGIQAMYFNDLNVYHGVGVGVHGCF